MIAAGGRVELPSLEAVERERERRRVRSRILRRRCEMLEGAAVEASATVVGGLRLCLCLRGGWD